MKIKLAALLLLGVAGCTEKNENAVDTVLLHGKIITMDDQDSVVEALAIEDGKIVKLGSDAEVSELIGPDTKVIDLKGRAATPGLIDVHAHILSTGESELYELSLGDAASVEDVVAAVAERAAKTPKGQWIVGRGWDEGKFPDLRYPTAADLDKVSPDNPVWLTHTTGHYGVANSLAFKLAGLDASTPTPTAGTIEKLPDGRPAGVLKETAQRLVREKIPDFTAKQREDALAHMIKRLHAEGMTGFKDPGINDDGWAAYMGLVNAKTLDVNACVLFRGGSTMESATNALASIRKAKAEIGPVSDSTLGVCGVKLFMDGSGAAPTAWMYEDWNHHRTEIASGNTGYPQIEPELFKQMVKMFVEADVSIGTHSIGDRAIDWTVDSYAAALAEMPKKDLKLTIIHSNTPTDRAIDTMAKLQSEYGSGYPENSASFGWWIGDIYAANLGPERSKRLNPFASYLKKGVIWGGASDTSVTPFPARYGLWASVARETSGGTYGKTPFGTDESVDIKTALKSFTVWAAPLIGAKGRTGVLAPGYSADIAVWDRNPVEVPTADIKEMKADMTLFQGRMVYERTAN